MLARVGVSKAWISCYALSRGVLALLISSLRRLFERDLLLPALCAYLRDPRLTGDGQALQFFVAMPARSGETREHIQLSERVAILARLASRGASFGQTPMETI
jgi:hypothetical protein